MGAIGRVRFEKFLNFLSDLMGTDPWRGPYRHLEIGVCPQDIACILYGWNTIGPYDRKTWSQIHGHYDILRVVDLLLDTVQQWEIIKRITSHICDLGAFLLHLVSNLQMQPFRKYLAGVLVFYPGKQLSGQPERGWHDATAMS